MKKNLLASFFEFLSETIMGAEKSFLDLLSALVPYAVPIIPAYLTFYHTWQMMNFPQWVAWTAAFVVEALGLASVSTAIRFYQHNRNYKLDKNKAPFWLAVVVYLFYIIVVLTTNVILEVVAGQRGAWIIAAIGLFSLLSVPSGVLISIRTQFAEMLENRYIRHMEARGKNLPPAQVPGMGFSSFARSEKHASDYHDKIIAMLDQAYDTKHRVLMPKDITAKLGLPHTNNKGYVSNLTHEWKKGKGIQ